MVTVQFQLFFFCFVAPAAFNVTAQVVLPSAAQDHINVTWTVSCTVMLLDVAYQPNL